jgi:hypothetical protein
MHFDKINSGDIGGIELATRYGISYRIFGPDVVIFLVKIAGPFCI